MHHLSGGYIKVIIINLYFYIHKIYKQTKNDKILYLNNDFGNQSKNMFCTKHILDG